MDPGEPGGVNVAAELARDHVCPKASSRINPRSEAQAPEYLLIFQIPAER
jgi:hypothetical protein